MIKKHARLGSMVLILALLLGLMSSTCFGAGLGFSVEAIKPDNQISDKPHLDLLVTPGQSQELSIRLTNTDDREVQVTAEATNAFTASDGHLDYSVPGVKDDTLPHPFTDLVQLADSQITLAPGESKDIAITLQAPQDSFEGKIIGGILLQQQPDPEEVARAQSGEPGTQILNVFQYALPVVLQQSEAAVEPEFQLTKVGPQLVNEQTAVQLHLYNSKGLVVSGGRLTAKFYSAGETTPLSTSQKSDFEMAPNSIWQLDFLNQGEYSFPPGDYSMELKVEYQGKTWEFDEAFTIAPAQTDGADPSPLDQRKAASATTGGVPMWAMILLGVGVLVLIPGIIVGMRVRKSNSEYRAYLAANPNQAPSQPDQPEPDPPEPEPAPFEPVQLEELDDPSDPPEPDLDPVDMADPEGQPEIESPFPQDDGNENNEDVSY